ncbi:peptide deformylase [Candidatus Parcubacteria bacterium]|nr:peptide deformylase [Candidatus Parcubacteria bacterium]
MTKDAIITLPHPLLRQKSQRIGHIDAQTRQLAADMIEATLDWEASRKHEFGAALAAVQIASPYRMVVIRNDLDNKADKSFSVFINPEITKAIGEPTEELEGCLSVDGIYGSVARYPKVKIKAQNLSGQPVRLTVTGFLAKVFQHEIDHTNGVVFVDRVNDPAKLYRIGPSGRFEPVTGGLPAAAPSTKPPSGDASRSNSSP